MDGNVSNSMFCKLCGDVSTLQGANPPRVLLCGHVFCGGCLWALEADSVLCPDCETLLLGQFVQAHRDKERLRVELWSKLPTSSMR
ncbi:hypothetical protein CRUP_006632, partial [Coryphaenoides rupestris]